MSSIDDRIVQMQFDNDQFQKGVAQTNDSLDLLNKKLQLDGATDGLNNVQKQVDGMNLGTIADGVDHISNAFSALGIIGINVLSRIAQDAISLGENLISQVLNPLIEGGKNRAIAIEQAKFQFRGLGLDITKTMAAAKAAVLGTQFGLQDAATAAAQLGASNITVGHGLEATLRGISGVAAQTGRSYSDIANIFEKVAGNGRLMGQDLLSLSASGLNAAAILAKSLHTTEANVRQMVTDGKISFAEFSKAMNNAFGKNAAKANETFTGALANMKAALSRIGADIFTPLDEAERKQFNALGPLFDKVHAAIQPVIDAFGQLANIQADQFVRDINNLNLAPLFALGQGLAPSLQNLIKAFIGIRDAIGQGFHEIFPKTTVSSVMNFTSAIYAFTKALIPSKKTATDIKNTFAGFFAILDIGFQIVSRLVKVILDLFGVATSGNGGFLSLTGTIGKFLVKVDQAIKSGHALNDFFTGLTNVLKAPIAVVKFFVSGIELLIDTIAKLVNGKGLDGFADDFKSRFSGLVKLGEFFIVVWEGLVKVFHAVTTFLQPVLGIIQKAVETIGTKIGDALKKMTFDDAIKAINTGLFGALVLSINGFFGNFGQIINGNRLAIAGPFKALITALRVNLKALEVNVNAKTLKEIAIAVALLAASAIALSFVDPKKLAIAMGAITLGFGQLLSAFAIIQKIDIKSGFLRSQLIAAALIELGVAILIFAGAIAILGALPIQNVIQGVIAVGVVLAILVLAAKGLSAVGPGIIITSAALLILAVAMNAMAGAIAILGALPLANLIQGMIAFTVILGELIVTTLLLKSGGPGMLVAAATLLVLGVAINAIAGAVAILGHLSIENLIKGVAALSVVLIELVVAMKIMQGSIFGAAAMILVATAVVILSGAFKIFSTLSWDEIGRGLVALGASLAILVVAMLLLSDPLVLIGAAALIVAAGALALIAPALKLLGTMSWDDIGRGLTVLGAALVILAVGGAALVFALPGLLGLGAAMLLIGEGALLAGIGIGLFAAGLALLGTVGFAALKLIGPAIAEFLKQLPAIAIAFGEAIGTFALVIATKGPEILAAIVTVGLALIQGLIKLIPPIVEAITLLITELVKALVVLIPLLVDAGLKIISGILKGIADNIGAITTQASNIMINFLNALSAKLPDIIKAGGNTILAFINGMGDYIRDNSAKFIAAGAKLFKAIVDGVSQAIAANGKLLRYAGEKIGNALIEGAKGALGINSPSKVFSEDIMPSVFEGIEKGNSVNIARANSSGQDIGNSMLDGVTSTLSKVADAVSLNVDASPTITPVLDLSSVKKDAALIPGMFGTPSLAIDTSTSAASAIAADQKQQTAAAGVDAVDTPNAPTTVTFEQNNYSPKALTATEIYRQSKNQISQVKKVLENA